MVQALSDKPFSVKWGFPSHQLPFWSQTTRAPTSVHQDLLFINAIVVFSKLYIISVVCSFSFRIILYCFEYWLSDY